MRIASGNFEHVAAGAKQFLERDDQASVLIFDDETGEVIDIDFRSAPPEPETLRRPGRPKLGVVAREITLLPRHWEWLNSQPGGASVALRKLVEEARRVNAAKDRVRKAQEAAYRFMSAMAGNQPGYEEAIRALFAGRQARFSEEIAAWPGDIREHTKKLSAGAFPTS